MSLNKYGIILLGFGGKKGPVIMNLVLFKICKYSDFELHIQPYFLTVPRRK